MNENIILSNIEKKESAEEVKNRERKEGGMFWTRMSITIEIDSQKENVWAEYQLGRDIITAECNKCGKNDQELEIQKPINIKIESDDPEIEKTVREKLEHLVKEVEKRMSVCNKCFDDDFLKKRPELYVATLEEVQKELGVEVDFKEQRENILGKEQGK